MGLNDPQWGKNKGDSGPPDLDDVLRNFNKKINDMFGQKKSGGGDDGPRFHPTQIQSHPNLQHPHDPRNSTEQL